MKKVPKFQNPEGVYWLWVWGARGSSKVPKLLSLKILEPVAYQGGSLKKDPKSQNPARASMDPKPIHPAQDFGILELFSRIPISRPQVPKFLITELLELWNPPQVPKFTVPKFQKL